MAVCSSNRSPSPASTRQNPNTNPNQNSRNQQERGIGDIRKSFSKSSSIKPSIIPHSHPRSFSLNTPANCPADYGRRASIGKQSAVVSSRDYEHKENERDPNFRPMKARSLAVSKETKSFMSPTVSAASKINASPKKRILGERKEAVRTSASLTDGKFQFYSVNSLDASGDGEIMTLTENSTPRSIDALPSLSTTDFEEVGKEGGEFSTKEFEDDKETVHSLSTVTKIDGGTDLVVLSPEVPLNSTDSEFLTSPDLLNASSSPSILAPLEADQSIPPYDPKTNYLSPRPRFLHYKPNPRIKVYLKKDNRLEDDFTSANSDETESTQETQSRDSQEEFEVASSVETTTEEVNPMSSEPQVRTLSVLNETVERKTVPKPLFSLTSKAAIAFFFLFWVASAAVLVTFSPVISNAALKDQTISKIYYDFHMDVEIAKTNINWLLRKLGPCSTQFAKYLSEMSSRLREVDKSNLWQFSNSTALDDYGYHVVEHFAFGRLYEAEGEDGVIKEVQELESNLESEEQAPPPGETGEVSNLDVRAEQLEENSGIFPVVAYKSQYYTNPINESLLVVDVSETHVVGDAELTPSEHLEAEQLEENSGFYPVLADYLQYDTDLIDESLIVHDDSETHLVKQTEFTESSEHSEAGRNTPKNDLTPDILDEGHNNELSQDEGDVNSCDSIKSGTRAVEPGSSMLEASAGKHRIIEALALASSRFSDPSYLGICLLVALLAAAAAFMYVKPKNASLDLSAKTYISKPVSSTVEPPFHAHPSSDSGPIEVDMISEPCCSELSSYQKSQSYSSSKKGGGLRRRADEAQSHEKKLRNNHNKRESLASSSSEYTMGLTSYGSFTTYGITHSEHGDEVVTPVRRSSRIRKQVTSS